MPEKIIIELDDEKDKPDKGENRIIIEFDEETKKLDIENLKENYQEKISKSKINSFFKGNQGLSNSFETDLKFPEGIEQGFRKKFSINLNDEFFNCILDNNKYIILSSKRGNVFLIDRFSGAIKEKIFIENESFEKTGLVFENVIYVNSLKKVFKLENANGEKIKHDEIYNSSKEYFIWSNLNRYKNLIIFTEFNPLKRQGCLKIIDINNLSEVINFNFDVKNFVSDKLCIADSCIYILLNSSLLVYDLEKKIGEIHPLGIKVDENSFIFYLNYRIYITSHLNELYYLDLPPVIYRLKNTGIKNNYINSIGGFADNIFLGALDGWIYYKSSGLSVYNFEDEYENKIEAISKNVLVVSQKNKIVFYNLNRFQEAEGYVIAAKENNDTVEIVSAIFSKNEIFVLTKNGILEVFTDDKLNIHI